MSFQKLARLLLGLSVVSVPLITSAWGRAGVMRTPISVAVTTASYCAWGRDCDCSRPKTELASMPVRPLPSDATLDRRLLSRPQAEVGLYSNPADLPRLARKIAPPRPADPPFCWFLRVAYRPH
jgi:hypothetical protein